LNDLQRAIIGGGRPAAWAVRSTPRVDPARKADVQQVGALGRRRRVFLPMSRILAF